MSKLLLEGLEPGSATFQAMKDFFIEDVLFVKDDKVYTTSLEVKLLCDLEQSLSNENGEKLSSIIKNEEGCIDFGTLKLCFKIKEEEEKL